MKNFIDWYEGVYSDSRNLLFAIVALVWLLSSAIVANVAPGISSAYAIGLGLLIVGFNWYIAKKIQKKAQDDEPTQPPTPTT